jgi:hypothetical protein
MKREKRKSVGIWGKNKKIKGKLKLVVPYKINAKRGKK